MATIVKTKDLMIEVARQLFARVGFTNTTMNDIADASKKGRRTLYTYFRNKDEIFHAVIERELERLWHDLELIRRLPASPEDKILTMLLTHLDKMKDLVLRNGSLRAEFFRDIWLVENSRAAFDEKEIRQLRELLEEGKEAGSSTSRHTPHGLPLAEHRQGYGSPFISGAYRSKGTVEEIRAAVRHLLLFGIRQSEEVPQRIQHLIR